MAIHHASGFQMECTRALPSRAASGMQVRRICCHTCNLKQFVTAHITTHEYICMHARACAPIGAVMHAAHKTLQHVRVIVTVTD